MHTDGDAVANLEQLGAEVTALGYHANVRTLAGRLPYLDVRNPAASVLAERVYVQGRLLLLVMGRTHRRMRPDRHCRRHPRPGTPHHRLRVTQRAVNQLPDWPRGRPGGYTPAARPSNP